MVPKVKTVESLIISNKLLEQLVCRFRKIIFYKDAQYLLLQLNDHWKILKTKDNCGELNLIEIGCKEYDDLKDQIEYLHDKVPISLTETEEEYWVVGISFNRLQNECSITSEFKISEKPLDILPYIIQTGAEYVFFSERGR